MSATIRNAFDPGFGVYVHWPFCLSKCPYCDFNSHVRRGDVDEDRFVEAFAAELAHRAALAPDRTVRSVFFGGGTPSLMSPSTVEAILSRIAGHCSMAKDVEITLEANPGTFEAGRFRGFREAGVTRLSIGVQSFSDEQLVRLGRVHDSRQALAAVRRARAAGATRINLDIMYALPRQTVRAAMADLDAALALEPDHISWYQLTLEPKTTFAARPPRLPGGSAIMRMEAGGGERLVSAGFTRYEVSAWARPGQACRHNLNYWTFGDYIGLGAGAHGKRSRRTTGAPFEPTGVAAWRTAKASQPRVYLAAPTETQSTPIETSALPLEFLMNALRLIDGVPFERFTTTTGLPLAALEPGWSHGVSRGLLRADRIATTESGLRYLDDVLAGFV